MSEIKVGLFMVTAYYLECLYFRKVGKLTQFLNKRVKNRVNISNVCPKVLKLKNLNNKVEDLKE